MPQDTAMRLSISNVRRLAILSLKRPEAPHASAARSAALLTDNHLLSGAVAQRVALPLSPKAVHCTKFVYDCRDKGERERLVIMSPCVVFHPTRCERKSRTMNTISEAYAILPLPLLHVLSTTLAEGRKQAESHMAL